MKDRGARPVLRVAAATVGLLVASCIPLGVAIIIALNLDEADNGVHWLAIGGAATLGIVPLAAGTVVATWSSDPATPRGRRHFLRLVSVSGLLVVASAAAVGIVALAGALPVWAAVVAIAGSVLFTCLSIWLGETIRRRIARDAPGELTPDELSPASVRRKWRRIVSSFLVSLVVGFVIAVLVDGTTGESNLLAVIAIAVGLAAFISSGVCLGICLPLVRRMPPLFAGDQDRQKKITKVVWNGRKTELDSAERELAVRYAGMMAGLVPFQAAQSVLLFLGLGALRVADLASGNTDLMVLNVGLLVTIVIVLIATIPFWIVRLRRVHRYLDNQSADVA